MSIGCVFNTKMTTEYYGASWSALHGPVAPTIRSRGRHDAGAGDRHVSGPMSLYGLQKVRPLRHTVVSSANLGRQSCRCAHSYVHFASTPPSSHAQLRPGTGTSALDRVRQKHFFHPLLCTRLPSLLFWSSLLAPDTVVGLSRLHMYLPAAEDALLYRFPFLCFFFVPLSNMSTPLALEIWR